MRLATPYCSLGLSLEERPTPTCQSAIMIDAKPQQPSQIYEDEYLFLRTWVLTGMHPNRGPAFFPCFLGRHVSILCAESLRSEPCAHT